MAIRFATKTIDFDSGELVLKFQDAYDNSVWVMELGLNVDDGWGYLSPEYEGQAIANGFGPRDTKLNTRAKGLALSKDGRKIAFSAINVDTLELLIRVIQLPETFVSTGTIDGPLDIYSVATGATLFEHTKTCRTNTVEEIDTFYAGSTAAINSGGWQYFPPGWPGDPSESDTVNPTKVSTTQYFGTEDLWFNDDGDFVYWVEQELKHSTSGEDFVTSLNGGSGTDLYGEQCYRKLRIYRNEITEPDSPTLISEFLLGFPNSPYKAGNAYANEILYAGGNVSSTYNIIESIVFRYANLFDGSRARLFVRIPNSPSNSPEYSPQPDPGGTGDGYANRLQDDDRDMFYLEPFIHLQDESTGKAAIIANLSNESPITTTSEDNFVTLANSAQYIQNGFPWERPDQANNIVEDDTGDDQTHPAPSSHDNFAPSMLCSPPRGVYAAAPFFRKATEDITPTAWACFRQNANGTISILEITDPDTFPEEPGLPRFALILTGARISLGIELNVAVDDVGICRLFSVVGSTITLPTGGEEITPSNPHDDSGNWGVDPSLNDCFVRREIFSATYDEGQSQLSGYTWAAIEDDAPPPPGDLPNVSVCRGRSALIFLDVTDIGAFADPEADPVTLSVQDLPSGVTVTFNPNPSSGGFTMLIETTNDSPLGTTETTVIGDDGTDELSATMNLTISDCSVSPGGRFKLSRLDFYGKSRWPIRPVE